MDVVWMLKKMAQKNTFHIGRHNKTHSNIKSKAKDLARFALLKLSVKKGYDSIS